MLIVEAITQWLADIQELTSVSSHQTYRYTLAAFQAFVHQHKPPICTVEDITLPLLLEYIAYLKKRRLADRTLHTYTNVLARWLGDLINDGEVAPLTSEQGKTLTPDGIRNRLQRKLPRIESPVAPRIPDLRRLPLYYDDQRTAFIEGRGGQVPSTNDKPGYRTYLNLLRNQALVEFLFSTGCRINEALGLRRLDVLQAGTIRSTVIVEGKGRKKRGLYISEDAQAALLAYLAARRALFPQADGLFISHGPRAAGQPISDVTAWRIIKDAAEAFAVTRELEGAHADEVQALRSISPHDFRHFFAQELLDAGGDLRHVSRALGHSNSRTTEQFYAEPDQTQVRDEVELYRPRKHRTMNGK